MAKKSSKKGQKQSSPASSSASPPTKLQKVTKTLSNIAESAIGKSQTTTLLEGNEGKRENTRSTLSRNFVWGYFISIFIVLWISYKKDFEISGYKDMLLAVSGVLSGPLGFIIGYYFKSENTK